MDESRLNQLFAAVANGEDTAESELYAQLRSRLLAIAFARGLSGADRDDVVQECLASAFIQVRNGRFKANSNPSTWVIAILINKIADHYRKRARSQAVASAAVERAQHPTVDIADADPETRLQVLGTLKRLTPIERFVLTGTELTGLTYEEIGRRLNCPSGTVASTNTGSRGSSENCSGKAALRGCSSNEAKMAMCS